MLSEQFIKELNDIKFRGDRYLVDIKKIIIQSENINVQDEYGNSLLILASYICNEEMVEFLLRNGANPNLCDSENITALGWSTKSGDINITELLLEYGADVNAQDNYGCTPLMNSLFVNNVSLVKLLLKNGAVVNVKDYHGLTALDYAIQRGYKNIEDILRNPDKYISEISREDECVSRLEEFKKIRKRIFR